MTEDQTEKKSSIRTIFNIRFHFLSTLSSHWIRSKSIPLIGSAHWGISFIKFAKDVVTYSLILYKKFQKVFSILTFFLIKGYMAPIIKYLSIFQLHISIMCQHSNLNANPQRFANPNMNQLLCVVLCLLCLIYLSTLSYLMFFFYYYYFHFVYFKFVGGMLCFEFPFLRD